MTGYYNQPENAKAFTPTASCAPATSASWTPGLHRIIDRKKDMIHGQRLQRVPNRQAGTGHHQCPGVLECAAIGVPDEKSGRRAVRVFMVQNDPALTATWKRSATKTSPATSARSTSRVPATICPKTNVGKILRRSCVTPIARDGVRRATRPTRF